MSESRVTQSARRMRAPWCTLCFGLEKSKLKRHGFTRESACSLARGLGRRTDHTAHFTFTSKTKPNDRVACTTKFCPTDCQQQNMGTPPRKHQRIAVPQNSHAPMRSARTTIIRPETPPTAGSTHARAPHTNRQHKQPNESTQDAHARTYITHKIKTPKRHITSQTRKSHVDAPWSEASARASSRW